MTQIVIATVSYAIFGATLPSTVAFFASLVLINWAFGNFAAKQ